MQPEKRLHSRAARTVAGNLVEDKKKEYTYRRIAVYCGMPHISAPLPSSSTPRRRWPVKAVIGLCVVVIAVLIGLSIRRHQAPSVTNNRTGATPTPSSYTDFIGQVTNIDGQLVTVLFRGTDPNGQPMQKTYQITIDKTTELKTMPANSNTNTTGSLALADLQPNATVLVAGSGDLAGVSSFTATKLFAFRN